MGMVGMVAERCVHNTEDFAQAQVIQKREFHETTYEPHEPFKYASPSSPLSSNAPSLGHSLHP